MRALDKSALICDFAEVYRIYEIDALDLELAATLACGLPDSSRSKKRIAGLSCDINTLLLAIIADRLSLLWWAKTEDGQKNRNAPESLAAVLAGKKEKEEDIVVFSSGEDFKKTWERLRNKGEQNG